MRAGIALGVVGLVVGALTVGPATAARKVKPGPVTGLGLTITQEADHYLVTANWDASAGATTYLVKMTDASGLSIPQASITLTSWSHTSYAAAGTGVTVSVTAYVGKVRGKTASVSAVLPDVTAPSAPTASSARPGTRPAATSPSSRTRCPTTWTRSPT